MKRTQTTGLSVALNYLTALSDRRVKYVFANSSTDFTAIIEAIVQAALINVITQPRDNI